MEKGPHISVVIAEKPLFIDGQWRRTHGSGQWRSATLHWWSLEKSLLILVIKVEGPSHIGGQRKTATLHWLSVEKGLLLLMVNGEDLLTWMSVEKGHLTLMVSEEVPPLYWTTLR